LGSEEAEGLKGEEAAQFSQQDHKHKKRDRTGLLTKERWGAPGHLENRTPKLRTSESHFEICRKFFITSCPGCFPET
jgi:hypothetical protein